MLPATGITSTTIAEIDEEVVTSVAASPVRTRSAATLVVLVTDAAASATFTMSPATDVVVDIEAVAAPRFTFWASTEVVIEISPNGTSLLPLCAYRRGCCDSGSGLGVNLFEAGGGRRRDCYDSVMLPFVHCLSGEGACDGE